MTTPYFTSVLSSNSLDQQYIPSSSRGRPRGSLKRGRKPRGAGFSSSLSPRPFVAPVADATSSAGTSSSQQVVPMSSGSQQAVPIPSGSQQAVPILDLSGFNLNPTAVYRPPILSTNRPGHAPDEDGEGEDELLPAMADDDYSAQLSWQSQSKDNLKYVISHYLPVRNVVPFITEF